MVSELVTNALRHALPADTPRHGEQNGPVRLHLMRWTERLVARCATPVTTVRWPARRTTSRRSRGRGLFLVDSFSDSWGWHPLAGTLNGKVVWALFRLHKPDDMTDPPAYE